MSRVWLTIVVTLLTFAAAVSGNMVELPGKWHFVLETDGGPREVDAEFTLEGEKVGGKWGDAEVKGTFADGKLALEFPLNSAEAGQGTLKITGGFQADDLKGTWTFLEYSGTFTAKRQ